MSMDLSLWYMQALPGEYTLWVPKEKLTRAYSQYSALERRLGSQVNDATRRSDRCEQALKEAEYRHAEALAQKERCHAEALAQQEMRHAEALAQQERRHAEALSEAGQTAVVLRNTIVHLTEPRPSCWSWLWKGRRRRCYRRAPVNDTATPPPYASKT